MSHWISSQSQLPSRSGVSGFPSAPEYAFVGKCENAKHLVTIFSTIQVKVDNGESQQGLVQINDRGMKLTYEHSKAFQGTKMFCFSLSRFLVLLVGSANVSRDIWNEYNLDRNSHLAPFKINLTHLIECLTIYSGPQNSSVSARVTVLYRGDGDSLELRLEEGGVQTNCRLKTYEREELIPFDIKGSIDQALNQIIITGDQLKEAFSEMDWSSQFVRIRLSPTEFHLSSEGQGGTCEIEYPAGNTELFEEFRCPVMLQNVYKIALLMPAVRSLNVAVKTQLRMNGLGLLSMRHMVRLENGKHAFTEFFIVSDIEYEL